MTCGLLPNAVGMVARQGAVLGSQTKNQLAPEEEGTYAPGDRRRLFTIGGVPFGIAICHEGWRYSEAVRWAARRGRVVFHPNLAGTGPGGVTGAPGAAPRRFGEPRPPCFEQARVARALENTVYIASVNDALCSPETATCIIAPDGRCIAHLPYSEEGLLVADLDLGAATGLYARRSAPERYRD